MTEKILLGYEVKTSEPIFIQPHHLAVFGMTQLSGKTTLIEALISRSGLRCIAFITKRGEAGFTDFHKILPYYKSQLGWRYVESLVDVALGEKVKYEPKMRYAIMTVSRDAKDLREVRVRCSELEKTAKKSWDREVYSKLGAYLDIVLPELDRITFADTVDLQTGVNVMDLVGLKLETQQLIIASTIRFVYEHLEDVIVIMPEAWEMLPQSRKTPVKLVAEQFIRKGASVHNYLWLDSQDIGGIDKTPLRQVSTWIMGRMMEAHEVERITKQLLGVKVLAQEIQTLSLGHFYVTVGKDVRKVYALPNGVPEDVARKVARGELTPEFVRDNYLKRKKEDEDEMYKEKYEEEHRIRKEFEKTLGEYSENLKTLQKAKKEIEKELESVGEQLVVTSSGMLKAEKEVERLGFEVKDLRKFKEIGESAEELRKAFTKFLRLDQAAVKTVSQEIGLQHTVTVVEVENVEKAVTVKTDTVAGKILTVAKKGILNSWTRLGDIVNAIREEGWTVTSQMVNNALNDMVKQQIIAKKHTDRNYFKVAKNVTFK